jgi:uncharacterized protein (DUF697 family)
MIQATVKDATKDTDRAATGQEECCAVTPEVCEKDVASNKIIKNHMLTAMGFGIIPLPGVDTLALITIQLNMLRNLAKFYKLPFPEHTVRSLLGSLVGSVSAVPIAVGLISASKFVPLLGSTLAALSMPVTAGAVTYAVGKVFNQHFASGGTFLTFDPKKVKDYYTEMLKEGKAKAKATKATIN